MFDNIIDTKTGISYSIFSSNGKRMLKNYLKSFLQVGGSEITITRDSIQQAVKIPNIASTKISQFEAQLAQTGMPYSNKVKILRNIEDWTSRAQNAIIQNLDKIIQKLNDENSVPDSSTSELIREAKKQKQLAEEKKVQAEANVELFTRLQPTFQEHFDTVEKFEQDSSTKEHITEAKAQNN